MLDFFEKLYEMFENSNSMEFRGALYEVSEMAIETLDFRTEYDENKCLAIASDIKRDHHAE